MGLDNRDYARSRSLDHPWRRLHQSPGETGPTTRWRPGIVFTYACIVIGGLLFDWIAQAAWAEKLFATSAALSQDAVAAGEVWRLVTFVFVSDHAFQIILLLLASLVGMVFESHRGKARTVWVMLAGTITALAAMVACTSVAKTTNDVHVGGVTCIAAALIAAFVRRCPSQATVETPSRMIGLRATVLLVAAVTFAIAILIAPAREFMLAQLAGAIGGWFAAGRARSLAEDTEPGVRANDGQLSEVEIELDRVLARINEAGMDALTDDEREFLAGQSHARQFAEGEIAGGQASPLPSNSSQASGNTSSQNRP